MITILYAGILGLIYIALSFYTIAGRFKYRISLGNGENEDMLCRIRTHANFSEYIPFALILMFMSEYQGMSDALAHGFGLALVLGRIIYSLTLTKIVDIPFGRQAGTLLTFSAIIGLSIIAILSYFN